jgi:UDP-4-amino-4,6-dideoxy-N-acetyl-beta-L-altrosamine transaminase
MSPAIQEKQNQAKKGFLPYGRQMIADDDIAAVVDVLKSDWLTQGPTVPQFERTLADIVSAKEVVACSNGTAALHLAMLALGIGHGEKVVTSTNSFLASANCARYVGADVVFADADPESGLISIESIEKILRKDKQRKIKTIIPVHFAGQPVDMEEIYRLAREHGAFIIEDACHALGASYNLAGDNTKIGSCRQSDMTVFSFHPVKHITTGEGGAITTSDPILAERLRKFRSHGIEKDDFQNREMAAASNGDKNPWYYEMQELGYNYRLTDIQAALGISQLEKLETSIKMRRALASYYDGLIADAFDNRYCRPLAKISDREHAYHLYVVRIDYEHFGRSRAAVMNGLRERGIGTQVHYIPIHLQPYYRKLYKSGPGDCPGAEQYYREALSLPLYPGLTTGDCERVIDELKYILTKQ